MFTCCLQLFTNNNSNSNSNTNTIELDIKEDEKTIDFIKQDSYKQFNLDGLIFNCYVNSIYDGDTIRIIIPMEINIHNFKNENKILLSEKTNIINYELKCRLHGIDSPEMKPLLNIPNREEHIKKAHLAKDFLSNEILHKVVKINFLPNDKYGRVLVIIYKNEVNINDLMITNGLAKPYDGGKKNNNF